MDPHSQHPAPGAHSGLTNGANSGGWPEPVGQWPPAQQQQSAGWPAPQAAAVPVSAHPMAPSQQEQIVLWIGDIGVSQHWVVTPNGSAPLAGSQWIVRDGTRLEEKMPAYAIVLAVIFFFVCLLGLLFLLIKERKLVGFVEVTVRSGETYHVAQIPVRHVSEVDGVRRQVHQVQSMAYALGQR
jgi:hypothetical protein